MQLSLSPDIEFLINKRLSRGGYLNAEDVVRRAMEAHDHEDYRDADDTSLFSAHIEEGYLQAERGQAIDSTQAMRDIQIMKEAWRLARR